MLLYFLNKPVFTHQHVLPVVGLTNTDDFQGGWLQRGPRQTRILYITSWVQCQYHAGRSANCPQSEELFLTMMQTPSKKSETNSPHLLCLLWASDRMYWGRWFTVDWKGNKQAGCQIFTLWLVHTKHGVCCSRSSCSLRWWLTTSESQVCVIMFEVLLLDATTPTNTQKHQWPRSPWPRCSGQPFPCICVSVDGALAHQRPSKCNKVFEKYKFKNLFYA